MIKILSILGDRRRRRDRTDFRRNEDVPRQPDPLWHPDLSAMTPHELADIPFPRPGSTQR